MTEQATTLTSAAAARGELAMEAISVSKDFKIGRGQILHCRPAGKKIAKVRTDGRDRRLLQHDLAEPDSVGIGRLARRRAPGQNAAMAIVPGEQRGGIGPPAGPFA